MRESIAHYMTLSNVKGALYSFCPLTKVIFTHEVFCYLARFLMRQHYVHHICLNKDLFCNDQKKRLNDVNILRRVVDVGRQDAHRTDADDVITAAGATAAAAAAAVQAAAAAAEQGNSGRRPPYADTPNNVLVGYQDYI